MRVKWMSFGLLSVAATMIAITCAVFGSPAIFASTANPRGLSIELSGPGYAQLGSTIPLSFVLSNASGESYSFLQADSSGNHAEFDYAIQMTGFSGAALTQTQYGLQASGQSSNPGSLRAALETLSSGSSTAGNFDLGAIYSIMSPGFYLVQITGPHAALSSVTSNVLPLIITSASSAPISGDLNGDGTVDLNDLAVIQAALNTPALGPRDPRDLNHDGVINIEDARILTTLCTYPRCASHP